MIDFGPEMPELKILVVGSRCAGKSTVAAQLRAEHRIARGVSLARELHHRLCVLAQAILEKASRVSALCSAFCLECCWPVVAWMM
jgi:hypothetical protein